MVFNVLKICIPRLLRSKDPYNPTDIINKSLLAGDKFMPEMHLRQLGFT